jgi:hypothetical protein
MSGPVNWRDAVGRHADPDLGRDRPERVVPALDVADLGRHPGRGDHELARAAGDVGVHVPHVGSRRYAVEGKGYSTAGRITRVGGQADIPLDEFLVPMVLASDAVVRDAS